LDVPAFFLEDQPHWSRQDWEDNILKPLVPMLKACTKLDGTDNQVKNGFKSGQGLLYNHSFGVRRTECILVRSHRTFLKSAEGAMFKLGGSSGASSSSKSMNKAYLKLKANFFPGSKECYLHTLLCHMFHGPAPTHPTQHVASHRCEHKLCICGWHMLWQTKQQDRVRHVMKRRRDEVP
jgi:hypothetical protein